jgi:hypothetical protein
MSYPELGQKSFNLTNGQYAPAAVLIDPVTGNSSLPSPLTPGLLPVDTLASIGVARQLAAGASSTNTVLTASCRRISIRARNGDVRFSIGTGAQTANASTSHFIAQDERLDFDVPASAQIAVIRAGTSDGIIELSELV